MSARETEGSALLAVTVALGLIAGACDGLSYLSLDGLFVANQTGNTVLLGLAVARGDGFATLEYVIAIAAFIVGLAAAALLIERLTRSGAKRMLPAVIVAEALLIALGAVIAGLFFKWQGGSMLFVVAAFTMLLALLTARMKLPALDRRPTPSAPDQP